jgi:hypothetical protein
MNRAHPEAISSLVGQPRQSVLPEQNFEHDAGLRQERR